MLKQPSTTPCRMAMAWLGNDRVKPVTLKAPRQFVSVFLRPRQKRSWRSKPAHTIIGMAEMQVLQQIAPDVKLGRDVRIYGFTNLYGCEIGDEVKIGTFV